MKSTLKEARDQQAGVLATAQRLNLQPPPYEFIEIIGKGSFGNVFKCRHLDSGRQSLAGTLVAVKIIDVDREDLAELWSRRAENISLFEKEVAVLVALSNSGARNVNKIYDAFSFGSSLWIVSELCPGGSVSTLMKASDGTGLDEHHVIPIARELAIALKDIHAASYLHRDVKAANVLITQDGRVQLCDFGVAGIREEVGSASKRTTIIGTPHWMPPEMHKEQSTSISQGYGTEVDCWSYGITVYELATGHPPNAHVPVDFLGSVDDPPRLDPESHSGGLCDFVAFCLEADPERRPSAAQILEHPYIAETDRSYPTTALKELVAKFRDWEATGGSRASLFIVPNEGGPLLEREDDDWNFADEQLDFEIDRAEQTPSTAKPYLTEWDRARAYQKAERAGERFQALFDVDSTTEYEYVDDCFRPQVVGPQTSRPAALSAEAPPLLRRSVSEQVPDNRLSTASGIIDLDEAMMPDEPPISSTLRPRQPPPRFLLEEADEDDQSSWYQDDDYTRRATREWRFPSNNDATSSGVSDFEDDHNRRTQDWSFASASRNTSRRTQDWTFPSSDSGLEDRRLTKQWTFPTTSQRQSTSARRPFDPVEARRRTQDWTMASAMATLSNDGGDTEADFDGDADIDGIDATTNDTPDLDRGSESGSPSDDVRSLPSRLGDLTQPSTFSRKIGETGDARRRTARSPSLAFIAAPSADALAPDVDASVVGNELVSLLSRMRVEVTRTLHNLDDTPALNGESALLNGVAR